MRERLSRHFLKFLSPEGFEEKYPKEFYAVINKDSIRELSSKIVSDTFLVLVNLFAVDETPLGRGLKIYYLFADRTGGNMIIFITEHLKEDKSFKSITDIVHAASLYEREIKDMFGLEPEGHPNAKRLVFHGNWPKEQFPLRKDFDPNIRQKIAKEEIVFSCVEGEGIFEVPVGPVHAGIIEPGHFRFSVAGEPIINLEAQLYYTHKGIEKMCEGQDFNKVLYFSERISGDETFSNSLAYCQAIEKIAGVEIPERAKYSRVVFAELERLTSHLGDLAGICLDTGFGFGAFQYRMMRGWAYLIADELCNMRFLRSVNIPGGIRRDFVQGKAGSIIHQLRQIEKELKDTYDFISNNSLFIDRVENTGTLDEEIARDLNIVGPAGRASKIKNDVRIDFPYAAYSHFNLDFLGLTNADVCSRMDIKCAECLESVKTMKLALENMPDGDIAVKINELPEFEIGFAMTESPRGENIHFIMTGKNGSIYRYKVRTPSFCNWPGVCHATRGNIIPDFPLINKSFNLSYAGNDL